MNEKKIISIVMPIFNPPKNLFKESLDSLNKCSDQNIEFILVDDGSEDYVKQICKEYSKKDQRFKYFNKINGGVSSARNFGINNSTGQYILFVDSDDQLNSMCINYYLKVINEAKPDFVFGDFEIIKNNRVIYSNLSKRYKKNNKSTKIMKDILCCKLPSSPWAKLYKKDIIIKHDIFFDTNLAIGEDLYFNYKYLSVIEQGYYISKIVYKYFIRENSAMTSKFNIKHIDSIKSINLIETEVIINQQKELIKNIYGRKCYEYISLYKKSKKTRFLKIFKPQIRVYSRFLIFNRNFYFKSRLKGFLYSIFL